MRPAELVDLRMRAQRISATEFERPADVVAWLGAVQAQDYLGSLWAVGLRLTGARDQDVERALAAGSIVRTWPMRGTLHFVTPADARWMLELLGPTVAAAAAGRFRQLGIDDATLARARRVLVKRLEGGRRLTRPAAYETLERAKVPVAGQRGIHILWRLAVERLICLGPREGKQQTVVLFDEWLPGAKSLPREEALAELAARYFTGHGPATIADFVWWSGLRVADARRAVELAGKGLDRVDVGGQAHWLAAAPAPSRERARAYLLPAFDELLVGYADRSAMLAPAHKLRVNAGGGILHPTMVVDRRVVGTWKRRLSRENVAFAPAPFATLDGREAAAVAEAFGRYAGFLGLAGAGASFRPSRSSSGSRKEIAMPKAKGHGTKDSPWVLETPPGTSEYEAYREPDADPPALVVQVGKTQLRYALRCIEDLHAMLKKHGDWMLLGSADEQKDAAEGTVEAWGRAKSNPVKGWYGLKKGLRGRFGMYVPPVLEALGMAEVEHNPKNNRMRAAGSKK